MKFVFKSLLVMVATLSISTAAFADDLVPAKKADIEKLLKMTGSLEIANLFGNAVTTQMFQQLKQVRPDIPEKTVDIISDETNKVINENINSLLGPMISIYARNLNHEEIKGLIAFYETPLGRKTVQVMPVMAQEGMKVGREWGQSLVPQLMQRIDDRLKKEKVIE